MELQMTKKKSGMTFRESETLELKKSTSELKEAVVSVASILNKHHWKGWPVPVTVPVTDFAGEC